MKKIILISSLVFSIFTTAQNIGFNNSGTSPDGSALLDLKANDKGLLVPRLTTTERDAIQNPAMSLLIFNTQTECFEAWNSNTSVWVPFGCIGCSSLPPVTTANAGIDQYVNCGDDFTALAGNTPSVGTGAWTLISGTGIITNPTSPTSGVTGLTVPGVATFRWTISNTCGSSYDDVVITTCNISNFSCGNPLTDIRDNEIYQTVQIGTQCWMAENLNYDPGSNSWCNSCATYGRLYNWTGAMTGSSSSNTNPSGIQGICPSGWHLPSDLEWCQMENVIEVNIDANCSNTGWRGANAGKHLKTSAWGGDNTSNFSALSAGYYFNGTFSNPGSFAYFWSTTNDNASNAWARYLSSASDQVGRNGANKTSFGASVRCIKD